MNLGEMMLDSWDDPVLIDKVGKWLEAKPNPLLLSLVQYATKCIEAGTVVERVTYSYIAGQMEESPVLIQSNQPKSASDLKALWAKVKMDEHRYVRFVLGMWAPSGHIRQRYDEDAKLLNDAFTGTYKGDAVDLFCDAMNAYSDTFDPHHYSGRIIAWCGPSGAGKSKGVDALQDRFPTYSICFRSSDDPSDGWPLGDIAVYQFFEAPTGSSSSGERVAAFLGAFLEIAALELQDRVSPAESARNVWRYKFEMGSTYQNSARGVLFTRVATLARKRLDEHLEKMQADDSDDVEPAVRYRRLWKEFCEAPAQTLLGKMSNVRYCFIALDEYIEIPKVQPIVLQRILEAANHLPQLWFILLGTHAKMQFLDPSSSKIKPTARFIRLPCLPAWCYFGFGELAPRDPDTPRSALQVDFLRRIGRPLFATYKTAADTYRNASKKLFSPQQVFNSNEPIHVLTAFSHRILLKLGSDDTAHQMAADSVNSNLRYATRIDGGIVRTVCPSEPLLSLVSADALNTGNNFSQALKILVAAVQTSTIDRGQEGELYCRLLIIRARDVALGNVDPSGNHDVDDTFSQASFAVRLITLEDHMNALVRLENTPAVTELRNFCRPYQVNITHMVQLNNTITAIPQSYLRHLFIRGAAVQCCHHQPVIDGFYVGYGGDLDRPFDLTKFIIVAWRSKARAAAASQGELVASLTGPLQIDAAGKRYKPAQLVILMDFNTKTSFDKGDPFVQVTHRQAKLPVYRKKHTPWDGYAAASEEPMTWCINIPGHDKASYPCTGATPEEVVAPDFSALFEEVGPDIVTNSIVAPACRAAEDSLYPLNI